ncbi:hypothetical protein Zmor_023599 [Zophobas morio]|uniref:Uncharacterized protein n=1 Tax=Zophobas morio TaxID=2755281 RepID=A0AA38HXJ9_9CUCU|nr:hypothetical protein Zmor_023599 [Zophobas morio]
MSDSEESRSSTPPCVIQAATSASNDILPQKSQQRYQLFLDKANDEKFLFPKVALIFGICGACRSHELKDLEIQDVQDLGSVLFISKENIGSLPPIEGSLSPKETEITEAEVPPASHALEDNVPSSIINKKENNAKAAESSNGRQRTQKVQGCNFWGSDSPEKLPGVRVSVRENRKDSQVFDFFSVFFVYNFFLFDVALLVSFGKKNEKPLGRP